MRVLALPAACAALFLIAGCSSGDEASAQNTEACTAFETSYNEFVDLVQNVPTDPAGVEAWTASKDSALTDISNHAGAATGEVQTAMNTLVDGLPADSLQLSEPDSESGQAFVDNADAVASACSADGTDLTLEEFPLLKFDQ